MSTIQQLTALEILDSRGRPTVSATCTLQGGATASASVPSGASTGSAEAHELRDGDPQRYGGLGCRKAVTNICSEINEALRNRPFASQEELDRALATLDGTENKSRLGANATLAVSIAFARAVAAEQHLPLHHYFAVQAGHSPQSLPRLTINLFSGGKHAGGQVAIQDVLIVPLADTVDESLARAYTVYQKAAAQAEKHFKMRLLRADEGGLAPPFPNTIAMLDGAIAAIEAAGYKPGQDVALAVDLASTQFYARGQYHLDGEILNGAGMIRLLTDWLDKYPIVSIEDGLSEEEWDYWPVLREAIGGRALVLGDDFLCTNPKRIQKAIDSGAADALLLKVNQIGTLTEALEAHRLARSANWAVTVSARSGETEDNWLADLAVGWGGDQIKIGSITQSERLSKYNRLLEIERETGLTIK